MSEANVPGSEIAAKMRFDSLRYSMVWEDVGLLHAALDVGPGDDVLSITSAGDNVLGLLLAEPRSVTAVDLNPCQSALLALKLAALRALDHDGFVTLLGVRAGTEAERAALYARCRPFLSEDARRYWDAHPEAVAAGIAGAGRLERYFAGWRPAVLHEALAPDEVAACFEMDDPAEQADFFARHLGQDAFRRGFEWYFGEAMMAERGRDRAQFAYAERAAGPHFYERFRYAFTHLPLKSNYYLAAFTMGRYRSPEDVPPYLQAAHYDRLRTLADRVTVVTGELEGLAASSPAGRFSKANLSDVFEYVSPAHQTAVLGALRRTFRPGGRLAYWSLLADRSLPAALHDRYRSLDDLAHALWLQDRAWFYRSFHVLEATS